MRKLLMGSMILTLFSVSDIVFQFSCNKKATAQTTPSPLTKDQIIVSKTWKVDKLHHVIAGQYSSYTSGGTNTTGIAYEKLRFTFNSNGTGVHIDPNGATQ